MKIFIKILTLITVICIVLSVVAFSVSAANSATLYFSKNTVKVGDDVTVSVAINPGQAMYAVSFYLEYDNSVLKYKGGNGVGDAGVLKVVESPSGTKSEMYEFKFTALKAGTSVFAVTDCVYEALGSDGAKTVNFAGASAKMTVKDPELSANANLKSLKVSGYTLSPSFSPSKTSYKVSVPNDVTKVNVTANTEDSAAKVKLVEGNTNLKEGENTVIVSIEAANGTLKKYTIKVTRLKKDENTSSEQDTNEIIGLEDYIETTVAGNPFEIVTKLPEEILFEGFSVKTTKVNGYDVEIAVDSDENFQIFYLKPADSEELVPYLYDTEIDSFEKLKYITVNKNYYIFSQFPYDYKLPDSLYSSTVKIGDFTVESVTGSDNSKYDFHYIYCFANGEFCSYRYDAAEETLQRYPDFEDGFSFKSSSKGEGLIARFNSLSTNGKVIVIALAVLLLGFFALVILSLVYICKKFFMRPKDIYLTEYEDDFDSVEVKK